MPAIVVKLATAAAAAAAAVAARQAVEYGWRITRGEQPPEGEATDGVEDDAQLRDVLVWSALLAGSIFLARKLAADQTRKLLGEEKK